MTPTQDATLTDAQVDELERLLDDLFPGRTMKAEFRRIFPQAKLANRPAPNAEMIREIREVGGRRMGRLYVVL